MRAGARLSAQQARWLALQGQGLDRPRSTVTVTRARLERLVQQLGVIQLDAVNVLARTQLIVPFSRLGAYDTGLWASMVGPGGGLLEGWAHMASVTPMDTQPRLRHRMESFFTGTTAGARARAAWAEAEAAYIDAVLDEVRQRGPLAAGMLSDPRPRQGEWWGRRSLGRVALEYLFARGRLAAWRSPSFERIYDLPERVVPAEVLARPTPPPEEAHRDLLAAAADALGVATVRDLADYYRMPLMRVRPRVAELVEAGRLVPAEVEGWREAAFTPAGARPRRPGRQGATLISPFDSLIWERARTLRLFGFDYRIEIYVPEPRRRYGYFVLPMLLGDELVARFDLKADRRAGLLRVNSAHLEPGAGAGPTAEAAAVELDAMRAWLGLDGVEVTGTGDLVPALGSALRSSANR